MGTSSSNGGPKGKNPLLPTWAQGENNADSIGGNEGVNDNTQSEKSDEDGSRKSGDETPSNEKKDSKNIIAGSDIVTEFWSSSRRALSKSLKKTTKSNLRKATKRYLKSLKGSRNATSASRRGVSIGRNYLSFLGGVSSLGFEQTLRVYNLADCIGKSSEEVFARIVDVIAPSGSTTDDAIARNALISALEKLLEKQIDTETDSVDLMSLTQEDVKDSIIEFISAYIFQKWIFEAGLVLEKNGMSEREIIDKEYEIKQFILDEVRENLPDDLIMNVDYQKGQGKEIIDEIFELAYSTLE